MTKNYYITTPIYYVNDKPHIGHAYTTIAADIIARFKRMDGYNVFFLTGTDEHGQKVEKAANKAGVDPQAFVDKGAQNFKDLMPLLNITKDHFIRTTDDYHEKAVQHMWNKLIESGDIYLDAYKGWYAVRDEAFYAESELVDGKAPTGAEVEWVEEPSYFFRLSKWQEPLLKFYEENPDFILPASRRNEVISFVKGGLLDLSVSRTSFSWGVPVPNDDKHIMYVWIDALTNYMSGVGYPDMESESYTNFWPADVHLVGKDILRFHAVYWPAFLMAAGLKLPKRVFAHGWWTNEGQKISKSLGNVIDPIELVNDFGVDLIRYFLIREVTFGQDGDFSKTALINRNNYDLANSLGNLVQRVVSFVMKNADGEAPGLLGLQEQDEALLTQSVEALKNVRAAYELQALNKVCDEVWALIGEANRYIDHQKPWALRKENPARMKTVLAVLLNTIRRIGLLVAPIMPTAGETIMAIFGETADNFDGYEREIEAGTALQPQDIIFKKLEGDA